MAKGQLRSTKEARKPKKEKPASSLATRSPTASALATNPAPAGRMRLPETPKR